MTPKRSADETIWNEDHWADAEVHPDLAAAGDEATAEHGRVATAEAPGGDDAEEFAHAGTHEPLPPRPRRKLTGPGTLVPVAVILIAGGFAGGVEVQKHRGGSTGTAAAGGAAGFASRAGGFGAAAGGTGTTGAAGAAGAASGTAGAATSSGTAGTVANVKGGTIYVTTTSGSTVRVVAADGATVQRTAKATMTGVHPGDTVVVTGTTKSDGTVSATAVTATAAGVTTTRGGFGGGFGGGFPGGGTGGTSTRSGAASGG